MNAEHSGPDDNDLALLNRFRHGGDREALGALFERYTGIAYRLARRFFHDPHDAEDAVQTAFVNVMRQTTHFEGRSSVKTWLLATVVNACRMKLREARRRDMREQNAVPPSQAANAELTPQAVQVLYASALKNLESLPEEYRLPVWMHYCEGLAYGEIAEALLISEPSVRRHAKRGLELLRASMPLSAAALATGGVATLLSAAPAEAAPATLCASVAQLAATPLHLLPAAPLLPALAGKALGTGAALKAAACVTLLVIGGTLIAAYNYSPSTAALARNSAGPRPAAPVPDDPPPPKPPPPLRDDPPAAPNGPTPELQAILDRRVSLRFTGDYLSAALHEIQLALPRNIDLPAGATEACWQGPWPGVRFEAADIRIEDALKRIAEQLKLRMAVRGGNIFFWRELAAAERAALSARLRDGGQPLEARLEAARDLLRCGDIHATADVLRVLIEQSGGLIQNGPGLAQRLLLLLHRTVDYRLTGDSDPRSPLVLLAEDAPLRDAVRDWLTAQQWAMNPKSASPLPAPPALALDEETLGIRRRVIRDFNLRLAAIFDLPDYLLALPPADFDGSPEQFSWALGFVQDKRCDELLWTMASQPRLDIENAWLRALAGHPAKLALGTRRDPRAIPKLIDLVEQDLNQTVAERAVNVLARSYPNDPNVGALLERIMVRNGNRPSNTAAQALGRYGDPARVRGLVRFTDGNTPKDLQQRATTALAQLRDPALDPVLLQILREYPDNDMLADCFAATRNPDTIAALGALVLDPKIQSRGAACNALGGMHSRAAVAKLIELFAAAPSEAVKADVLRGLQLVHDEESEAFLASLTASDKEPRLRFLALQCLRRARTETGVVALQRNSFDPMPNIRVMALNTLIYIDSDAARETLMKAMATEADPSIRAAPPSCAKQYPIWDLDVRRRLFAGLREAYKADPPIRFALLRNLSGDLGSPATHTLMKQALLEPHQSIPYIAVEELMRREETYVEALSLLLEGGRFDAALRKRAAAVFVYPNAAEDRPHDEERLLAAYKSLRHSATSDPEPVVRLAAVFSLERHRSNPETMFALKTIADKDASTLVQRGVKLVLSGNMKRGDAVRAVENPASFMPVKPPTEGLEF